MELRTFRADEGMRIKDARLRALRDAPYAFGAGAFDEESGFPDSYWHELAAQVGGAVAAWRDRCVNFVALDGERACGTAIVYLCPRVAGHAYLTALWIDPEVRRRGLGRQLVDAAIAWARPRGAEDLRLWVDATNPSAVEFYRALGFEPTGEKQPVREGATDEQACFTRRLPHEG
jgi:ribosomal protein S18 acetylase RimI-like enzyme